MAKKLKVEQEEVVETEFVPESVEAPVETEEVVLDAEPAVEVEPELTESVPVEEVAEPAPEAVKSALLLTERVIEGKTFTFVKCPDGCEYELENVPREFKHLL